MADRRLIAQSITNSGQVAQLVKRCGPWGAVLFTWVLTFIDDDSRFEGDPETLRHKVLGRYLDHVDADLIAEIVATMNDIDLAVWYEVQGSPGERYLYFPRFTTHQTLREDRYGPSRLPAPPSWQPEEGHPYTKNAQRISSWKAGEPTVRDLRKEKPQRDLRRTLRVPKRAVNKGESSTPAPTAQPPRDQPAPVAQPPGHAAGTEDAPRPTSPRPATSPLDSSRLATAEGNGAADELRSGDARTRGRMRPVAQGVTELTRDVRVGRHYRDLMDLEVDVTAWPKGQPLPGMLQDGRVRDRFGTVHASHITFTEWAHREAELLTDAEMKIEAEHAQEQQAIEGDAAVDEPGIAEHAREESA